MSGRFGRLALDVSFEESKHPRDSSGKFGSGGGSGEQWTDKHKKILSASKSPQGWTAEVYPKEAAELAAAGLIEKKEVISKAGGRRSYRWFAK